MDILFGDAPTLVVALLFAIYGSVNRPLGRAILRRS
jgi:hypothetical protein